MTETVNDSVLSVWGLCCPKCHKDDSLEIEIKTGARLYPNGTDLGESENGDHTWDGSSECRCIACGYSGVVAQFEVDETIVLRGALRGLLDQVYQMQGMFKDDESLEAAIRAAERAV